MQQLGSTRNRAFAFQAAAMLAVLGAEFLASRQAHPEAYGEYAYVRQLVLPVSAVFAFGLDSSLIRANRNTVGRSELSLLAVCLGSGAGVAVFATIWATKAAPVSSTGLIGAFAAMSLTVLWIESGLLRSQRRYFGATIRVNVPRLVGALWIVVIASLRYEVSSAALIAGTSAASGVLAANFVRHSRGLRERTAAVGWSHLVAGLWDLARSGKWFFISAVTLASLDFVDLEALRVVSDATTLGTYAAAKVTTLMPFIGVASVVGFILMPELRHRGANSQTMVALLGGTSAVSVCGMLLIIAIDTQVSLLPVALPTAAGLLLLASGGLRLMSVVYSAVVGAFALPQQLAQFALGAVLSLVAEWAVIVALPLPPLTAAAAGQFAGTSIRGGVGIWIAWRVIHSGDYSRRSLRTERAVEGGEDGAVPPP